MRPSPHLYEISARPWLHELSRRYGRPLRLADVPASEWDALADLGFDLVYLMGVWRRSAFGRHQSRTDPVFFAEYDEALPGWDLDDVLGSPFAVAAYEPDPAIGTWEDLAGLRADLHRRGMGLVLDLVPNHTAPDHAWVRERPGCYVHGTLEDFRRDPSAYHLVEGEDAGAEGVGGHRFVARGRDPYFPPWPDTAQLDHAGDEAAAALLADLRRIREVCDGLRCDMAMLLLEDVFAGTWGRPARPFWDRVRAAAPELLLIAEVYWGMEDRLLALGFDYTYDKAAYDALVAGDAARLRELLHAPQERQARMVRFLENHDEPRAGAVVGPARMEAAATLAATLPGMRFYHHGQLEGRTRRLPVRLRATAPEDPDPAVAALHDRLLRLTDHDDFHTGAWRLLDVQAGAGGDGLVAAVWQGGAADRVVVGNLGGATAEGTLRVRAPEAAEVDVVDDLHDRTYRWSGAALAADGLFVRLDAHRAHVLRLVAR